MSGEPARRAVANRAGLRSRWAARGAVLLLIAILGDACTSNARLARQGAPGFRQSGVASWYGPGFDGKRTANGEVYDMNALTAAHQRLPFDTVVEVTHRDNGRSVRVRINDRGPFIRGRVIDLSRAAAEQIDMLRSGTARVTLRVVAAGRSEASGWTVQAGAFRDRQRAEDRLAEVRRVDRRARLAASGAWHRVLIGPLGSRKQARNLAAALERRGIDALVRGPS